MNLRSNVKFTCTTGEKIGKTVVMLSYDTSAMEFIGGEPDVSGGNGAIRVIGSVSGSSEVCLYHSFQSTEGRKQ
ncbi:MAG: hypothetical protein ACLUD2_06675 [Clostridium sp.]